MSHEWLANVLEKKYGIRPSIEKAGSIDEASHGYMAQIRRVQLQWPTDNNNDQLPKSVVVKPYGVRKNSQTPSAGSAADAWTAASGELTEEQRNAACDAAAIQMKKVQEMCHTTESQIYNLFDESYPAPFPIPKTYASFGIDTDHPAIIMEDITHATVYDIVDGFTEKQLYTLIDCIIDLHVLSFTSDKWKTMTFEQDDELAQGFVKMAIMFVDELIKRTPLPCLEKIRKHILNSSAWFVDPFNIYQNHPLSVLVHGDMWAPQFLWRGDTLAAIVDWQLAHPGPIMEDFQRLIGLGIPAADRERLNPILLKYYYEQLSSKLEAKGTKIPFTFDEMMEEYKKTLPYTVGMSIFAFCMWSNSPVLKRGKEDDAARIKEMFTRTISIVEECVNAYGW